MMQFLLFFGIFQIYRIHYCYHIFQHYENWWNSTHKSIPRGINLSEFIIIYRKKNFFCVNYLPNTGTTLKHYKNWSRLECWCLRMLMFSNYIYHVQCYKLKEKHQIREYISIICQGKPNTSLLMSPSMLSRHTSLPSGLKRKKITILQNENFKIELLHI